MTTLRLQNTFSGDSCVLGDLYLQAAQALKIPKFKENIFSKSP